MAQVETSVSVGLRRFVHTYPRQRVVFGPGEAGALAPILELLGVERALLLSGPNVAANGALVGGIREGSGGRIGAAFGGIGEHAPFPDVEAALDAYRSASCDGVVSVGGGSSHDAARALGLCLATGLPLREHFGGDTSFTHYQDTPLSPPPLVAIPTTLSAAETTFGGGVTDPADDRKYVFVGHALYISHVVLDPDVFATTPLDVLVSTGMNAVNHAVERLSSPTLQPIVEASLHGALRLLLPSLPRVARSQAADTEALAQAIVGAHMSESVNVFSGLGHALVHQLGGRYRAGHGVLNGIVLPHVLRFVTPAVPEQIARMEAALADVAPAPLADFFAAFVAELGLPGRLRDVGVPRDELPEVAEAVMGDISLPHSARPIAAADELIPLLEACW